MTTTLRPSMNLPTPFHASACPAAWLVLLVLGLAGNGSAQAPERLRLVIETDAGGDPDDEQSLVRFLLYVNEWDVEGIIANRPEARRGENKNQERTGLGIVRQLLRAYEASWTNLVVHDPRYPPADRLRSVTVPGHDRTEDAVRLLIAAVDRPDPRPLWYSDWGTDHGAATNNLRRALDRVLRERGPEGYAQFKRRLRLVSADAFAHHLADQQPPFALWVDTFRPPVDGLRWYHRFSALTATAGGFDIERDVRQGHGPLGPLYPLNTTHPQKEGDSMTFIYLIPTGMNDPFQPTWGSWAGRYSRNTNFLDRAYYWAGEADAWHGTSHRDNVLARWAVALQNDFKVRMDWCVAANFNQANHRPVAVLNGDRSGAILELAAQPGETVTLSALGSHDPDGQEVSFTWVVYPEAGTVREGARLATGTGDTTAFRAPAVQGSQSLHILLQVEDDGAPALVAYRRAVVIIRGNGRVPKG